MKKIYTIFAAIVLYVCWLGFVIPTHAQNSSTVLLANGMTKQLIHSNANAIHHSNHHEKSGPAPFWIDLDSADAFNQNSLGMNYSRLEWSSNAHYVTSDTTGGHYGMKNQYYVVFDTLVDSYNSNGPTGYGRSYYPTVRVDSLKLWFAQQNNSGIDDTLVISIRHVLHPSTVIYNYPDTTNISTNIYSVDTIFIPASQPLIGGLVFAPNNGNGIQLPTNIFTVKVEYLGNKQDTFMFVAGFPSFSGYGGCAGFTMADSSSYHPNSFYKDNIQFHRMWPGTNDESVYYECNGVNGFQYGVDGSDYIQNIGIYALVFIGDTLCNNLTIATTPTDASCGTCLNGTVSSTYSGGTSPYTYLWSNGATTQNITGLNPGTFSVTITDVNNCTAVSSASVGNSACGGFYATLNPTSALCATCADGWVSCSITGGTSPYTFNWSNGATTQNATQLLPGNYAVTITDAASCVLNQGTTITNANLCSSHFLLYPDTAAHTYWIVNQAYGTPVVHYDWDWGDASFHDTIAFPTHTYAAAGNYTICLAITDGIGCSTSYCNSYYLSRTANQMVYMYVIPSNVGIKEVKAKNFISVLPNPNDGNFTLSYNLPKSQLSIVNCQFILTDIAGRVVYKQTTTSMEGKETIHANLLNGIYYWEMMNEGKILEKGKIAVMK